MNVGKKRGETQIPSQRNAQRGVTLGPSKNGLRIRWRIKNQQKELYISPSVPNFCTTAHSIKSILEQDLASNSYDETLQKYKALLALTAASRELWVEQQKLSLPTLPGNTRDETHLAKSSGKFEVLKEFGRFLAARSMSIDSPELSSYYTQTIAMLKKWGDFDIEDTPVMLSRETFGNKTFNDRRNCLNSFFEWCVRKKKLNENPLADVASRKRTRNCDERKPFTSQEARLILEALRTDRFKHKSSSATHSQYYPFVAFMLYTGVRTAEALGLKVKDIIFPTEDQFRTGIIRIGRALARTNKGTHMAARKEKGTKNNKARDLGFNKYLFDLLMPLCVNRKPDDLVFVNERGNPIDDKMFLRRVFKPIQERLRIPYRHLYALRHTFATNAVESGMLAFQVAYLMGDLTETVLKNYFHNERRPDYMPAPVTEFGSLVIPIEPAIQQAS